jgi:hypothetical protein
VKRDVRSSVLISIACSGFSVGGGRALWTVLHSVKVSTVDAI